MARRAHRDAQQDGDDVHQLVLSGFADPLHHAALAEEVTEHQHADEGRRTGQQQHADDRDENREQDFFQLGNGAQLGHDDRALLLSGQSRIIGGWMMGTSAIYE